jgi:hypothetical protein
MNLNARSYNEMRQLGPDATSYRIGSSAGGSSGAAGANPIRNNSVISITPNLNTNLSTMPTLATIGTAAPSMTPAQTNKSSYELFLMRWQRFYLKREFTRLSILSTFVNLFIVMWNLWKLNFVATIDARTSHKVNSTFDVDATRLSFSNSPPFDLPEPTLTILITCSIVFLFNILTIVSSNQKCSSFRFNIRV